MSGHMNGLDFQLRIWIVIQACMKSEITNLFMTGRQIDQKLPVVLHPEICGSLPRGGIQSDKLIPIGCDAI